MRPQLKSDEALPDSSDKSGERASQTGQRWGDADLRPPTAPHPRPKTKLALGAPPPPAGLPEPVAAVEDEVDAVAGLFATDLTLPAPGINDAPSEAEIGRWVATAHTSLFDDRVKDPAPAAAPAPIGRGSEPQRRPSTPKLPAVDPNAHTMLGISEPAAVLRMSEPEEMPSYKQRAPAPPPPASPMPAPARGSGSGARKKSAVVQPKVAAAVEVDDEQDTNDEVPLKVGRKRRFERGPSKVLLICVGSAALLSLGAAAMLIGVMPNPLTPAPARSEMPARRARPAPVPAKVAAEKPKLVAAPAKPAPVAAAAATAKAVPAKAASQTALNPQAKLPTAPSPVPLAAAAKPAPEPARASDEGEGDDSDAYGSGKLAQARKLLAADNPQGAEALARQVLAADPQDHHAMDMLVRALMDQDRGPEALPFARKMVQKRTKRVPYRLLLGDLLLMVGDAAGAHAEWQNALALAPNDREIKRRLGK